MGEKWVTVVKKEAQDCSICAHYSAKFNRSRKINADFENFNNFLSNITAEKEDTNTEILIVTGSGEKGKFNSVSALEWLGEKRERMVGSSDEFSSSYNIAVAYNPFFPSTDDQKIENERLLKKIATNQVNKIYLQFGTDLVKLRSSLDWLTNIISKEKIKSNNVIKICGSIFLPTKKLIAQQKFRPWNGVFLNEEFLGSEIKAKGIVLEMISLYNEFECELLIE